VIERDFKILKAKKLSIPLFFVFGKRVSDIVSYSKSKQYVNTITFENEKKLETEIDTDRFTSINI